MGKTTELSKNIRDKNVNLNKGLQVTSRKVSIGDDCWYDNSEMEEI